MHLWWVMRQRSILLNHSWEYQKKTLSVVKAFFVSTISYLKFNWISEQLNLTYASESKLLCFIRMWLFLNNNIALCSLYIHILCILGSNPANIWWSSRHALKMSLTRLQRNNFSSSKTSWRSLEDVLEDEKLLRWRRFQDVLKTYLEDVFKTSWWQTKYLLGKSCI